MATQTLVSGITVEDDDDEGTVATRHTAGQLAARLEQLEQDREDSSRRLRVELEELRRRFETALSRSESSPLDVDRMRFPPRLVAAIVVTVISIFGGMYASTYGLRSDVRNILTTMENEKKVEEVQQELDKVQAAALRDSISTIDKRQQLQQIEIQELKEMVLQVRSGRQP